MKKYNSALLGYYYEELFNIFVFHFSNLVEGNKLEKMFVQHKEKVFEMIYNFCLAEQEHYCSKLLEDALDVFRKRKQEKFEQFYCTAIALNNKFAKENAKNNDTFKKLKLKLFTPVQEYSQTEIKNKEEPQIEITNKIEEHAKEINDEKNVKKCSLF